MSNSITPALLLRAYRAGIFPMAEDANATEIYWFDPPERTVFPLDAFHVPTRLRRTIRRQPYRLTLNCAFTEVMRGCAKPNPAMGRGKTWINEEILTLYSALHSQGHAHSIEAWHGERLVGGLYGVQVGGAFCGESMFSNMTDASKICLVALVAMLRKQGFALLDCQFMTPHLRSFGAMTIDRADYQRQLITASALHCSVFSSASPAFCSGGTYPGTATGSPSDGKGVLTTGAASDSTPGADAALAAALTGFLQEITQAS